VPLLAKAADYMAIWQLPIVAVLGGVWVFLGGYLLRRNLQASVGRREAASNRCLLIAFLAGLGGVFSAGVVVVLAMQVAKSINVQTIWLASPAAAVAFCLVSFLTVLASFKLPVVDVGKAWLKSFGPPLLLIAVAMIPTVWVAETNRQDELSRMKSFNCLQYIYAGIANRYIAAKPPATLEELLTSNIIEPKYLQSHRHRSRKIGFFYHPVTRVPANEPTRKLMLCDWVDNLNGRSRTVVYANGKTELLDNAQFQKILNLDENKAFAADLKEAESKL
jgi:hypothetical protein